MVEVQCLFKFHYCSFPELLLVLRDRLEFISEYRKVHTIFSLKD